jgi:hypothetical protein
MSAFAPGAATAETTSSPLLLSRDGGQLAHVFPTFPVANALGLVRTEKAPPVTPALIYHGGPVMQPFLNLYIIYWQPSTLQDGSTTIMSNGYKAVEKDMVSGYPGHALASITTQYYQTTPTKTYITGTGGLAFAVNDTQPFPTSGCAASIGPNCITDAQLKAEVQRFLGVKGWTGGYDKMFLVFTPQNEGSCFDTSTTYCSTETANVSPYFCAYHSYISGSPNIIYSNEPFGNPNYCLGSGTQPNSTAGGPEADPAATAASHEMTEAFTDPLLNAWYDSSGSEIGDICAYNYGANQWDKALANQFWLGKFFELQTEYSNHHAKCEQVGP